MLRDWDGSGDLSRSGVEEERNSPLSETVVGPPKLIVGVSECYSGLGLLKSWISLVHL